MLLLRRRVKMRKTKKKESRLQVLVLAFPVAALEEDAVNAVVSLIKIKECKLNTDQRQLWALYEVSEDRKGLGEERWWWNENKRRINKRKRKPRFKYPETP